MIFVKMADLLDCFCGPCGKLENDIIGSEAKNAQGHETFVK